MRTKEVDYKRAAKTTFLFSTVQIVTIVTAIIRNKVIAVLLGTTGVGLISVFTTYTNFVKTGACLGLSQSAVRDISEAFEASDSERFSRVISLTNRLVIFTSALGIIVTIVLSPHFSNWGFGNNKYIWSFVLLSLSVGFQIYSENRVAILKGMRRMKSLAISTIIGSVAGLVISIPFYYIMGNDGIVPTLLLSAFVSVIATNYFVNKIDYERVSLKVKEIVVEGKPMIQMGCALMMINFLSGIFDTIIISYLSGAGGLDVVAFYGAGRTIIGGYFSVVLTAMWTDFYPRLCGVYKYNNRIEDEVNAQTKLGLILVFPLAIIFIAFASLFIPLLYSSDFMKVSVYTDWALLGTLISVPSNCIGMVLLAKQDAKLFTVFSVIMNVINLFLYIGAFRIAGLAGLGIATAINVGLQWIGQLALVNRKYGINFSKEANIMLVIVLIFSLISIMSKRIDNVVVMNLVQVVLILISLSYSFFYSKRMGIDILSYVKNKIKK